jgi:hypothetical protein
MNLFMESALPRELRYFIIIARFYTASAGSGALGQLEGHGATLVWGIEECGNAILRIGTPVQAARKDAHRHCIPEGL